MTRQAPIVPGVLLLAQHDPANLGKTLSPPSQPSTSWTSSSPKLPSSRHNPQSISNSPFGQALSPTMAARAPILKMSSNEFQVSVSNPSTSPSTPPWDDHSRRRRHCMPIKAQRHLQIETPRREQPGGSANGPLSPCSHNRILHSGLVEATTRLCRGNLRQTHFELANQRRATS